MEQRDEEMGRREENRGPERASESEEIDRTLEQIMDNQKQEKKKRPGKKKWILAAGILGLGILGIKMVSTGGSQTPVVAVIPLAVHQRACIRYGPRGCCVEYPCRDSSDERKGRG